MHINVKTYDKIYVNRNATNELIKFKSANYNNKNIYKLLKLPLKYKVSLVEI